MRLFTSPASPFARKVVACAIARGIADQITMVPVASSSPELAAHNPLGKLPCLVTNDGVALFDSRVICLYLDTVGDGFPMHPEHGLRIRTLRFEALGDGICDAAVLRRGEMARASEAGRDAVIAAQGLKVARSVDALEAEPPPAHVDIGSIAIACALGYLDFRFSQDPWRDGHPRLAAWYEGMLSIPCIAQTMPG